MNVYIIIMQSTIGNEKTRLCSTQCYGGTFVSEESANTFLNEHKDDIFKDRIARVRYMEVDLLDGISTFHRDVLYTITIATNFDDDNRKIDAKNGLHTTSAIPDIRDSNRHLDGFCYRPRYLFGDAAKDLHLVSRGEASAYFENENGEKKAYLRIDRLIFNHSDKIGFVMN